MLFFFQFTCVLSLPQIKKELADKQGPDSPETLLRKELADVHAQLQDAKLAHSKLERDIVAAGTRYAIEAELHQQTRNRLLSTDDQNRKLDILVKEMESSQRESQLLLKAQTDRVEDLSRQITHLESSLTRQKDYISTVCALPLSLLFVFSHLTLILQLESDRRAHKEISENQKKQMEAWRSTVTSAESSATLWLSQCTDVESKLASLTAEHEIMKATLTQQLLTLQTDHSRLVLYMSTRQRPPLPSYHLNACL